MMLLNSDVDNLNIRGMLSKLIDISRKSVYNTMNRLSSGGERSSLLKSVTPITLEIKDIIIVFWTNESRVSTNNKDL